MTTTASLEILAEPGTPFIDITREVDAPRDLVFRAYTEPELLAQWLGPRQYTMTVEEWDVRHGGRWRYVHGDDQGHAFGFRGVFHGTPSPDLSLQTFEFEGAPGHVALESLVLEAAGSRTIIRNHSTHQSVADRDAMLEGGMAEGMRDGFERLDELLARLRAAG